MKLYDWYIVIISYMIMEPISGTRDFYPRDMCIRNWLFDTWMDTSEKFGFQNYDCPIVENADMYTRKGGDDILNEMYTFQIGENKYALRPEMTPSIARMMTKCYKNGPVPFKWYSIGQCWRNETVCKGRKKEHYQWNVDIIGQVGSIADVELLLLIVTFLKNVGLTHDIVEIRVSNRIILQKVLKKMEINDDDCVKIYNIIDKIKKKKG